MDKKLYDCLVLEETDVEGALKRLAGDEDLYCSLLAQFLVDHTMNSLSVAIRDQDIEAAVTAAHALKGLTANLGLIPLSYSISNLVVLLRSGGRDEIEESYQVVVRYYKDIIAVIQNHMDVLSH